MGKKTLKEILDVNGDGKVDGQDFIDGIKGVLDYDKDGKVEVSDIIKLCKDIVEAL